MKIKDGYILRDIGKEYIVLPCRLENIDTSMITLNKTGAFLWKNMETNQTKEGLVERLLENYDVSSEQAMEDIEWFISKLASNNLVE